MRPAPCTCSQRLAVVYLSRDLHPVPTATCCCEGFPRDWGPGSCAPVSYTRILLAPTVIVWSQVRDLFWLTALAFAVQTS